MTTTLTETDAFPAVTIPAGGEARSITSLAGAFQSLTSRTAWLIARLREFYDNTAGTGGVFALRTAASIADMKALHLAFFDGCLRGKGPGLVAPSARIYVTGANVWRTFDTYPPLAATPRLLSESV